MLHASHLLPLALSGTSSKILPLRCFFPLLCLQPCRSITCMRRPAQLSALNARSICFPTPLTLTSRPIIVESKMCGRMFSTSCLNLHHILVRPVPQSISQPCRHIKARWRNALDLGPSSLPTAATVRFRIEFRALEATAVLVSRRMPEACFWCRQYSRLLPQQPFLPLSSCQSSLNHVPIFVPSSDGWYTGMTFVAKPGKPQTLKCGSNFIWMGPAILGSSPACGTRYGSYVASCAGKHECVVNFPSDHEAHHNCKDSDKIGYFGRFHCGERVRKTVREWTSEVTDLPFVNEGDTLENKCPAGSTVVFSDSNFGSGKDCQGADVTNRLNELTMGSNVSRIPITLDNLMLPRDPCSGRGGFTHSVLRTKGVCKGEFSQTRRRSPHT